MRPAEFRRHVARYGFSLKTISMREAQRRAFRGVQAGTGPRPFKGFDDYHRWYMREGRPIPTYASRWPVIESPFADEWLEDGWHRFHSYVEAGDTIVLVLRFHLLEMAEPGHRMGTHAASLT